MKRIIVIFAVIVICLQLTACFGMFYGSSDETTTMPDSPVQQVENGEGTEERRTTIPAAITEEQPFDGDPGIVASAVIGDSIIGYPEITINVKNTTDKDIAAMQFYAVPFDVYGDEIKSFMSQNRLSTDNEISTGKTKELTYQLIDASVKSIDLYIYSVYFSDGSEWGDRNATASEILKNAPAIEVSVEQ